MRVMLFFKNNMDTEGGLAPTPEMLEAFKKMDEFTEELVKAGVFVAGAGLKPSAQSKRVVYDGRGGSKVIDGPFTEARELVAGFSIWEVKDMDEAMAWVARAAPIRCRTARARSRSGRSTSRPIWRIS